MLFYSMNFTAYIRFCFRLACLFIGLQVATFEATILDRCVHKSLAEGLSVPQLATRSLGWNVQWIISPSDGQADLFSAKLQIMAVTEIGDCIITFFVTRIGKLWILSIIYHMFLMIFL